MPKKEKPLLDFVVAGLPRSGTSSMQDLLGQHPDIYMTPIKEPNHFCTDFHEESDRFHGKPHYFPYRRWSRYKRLYADRSREAIAGEASWTNLYSRVAATRIARCNPEIRVLIMLREPVSFLSSYHSAATFALGEHIEDFDTALAAEDARRRGKQLGRRVIVPSWLWYRDFVAYSAHVERYLSIFPRQQLKLVILDDLKETPLELYRDILRFLGVDSGFHPRFSIVNPNKVLRWPRVKKLVLDSPYFRKTLRHLVSDSRYAALKNFYKRRLVTYRPRQPLSEDTRRNLMVSLLPEVEKMSRLCGRDLVALWGYDRL